MDWIPESLEAIGPGGLPWWQWIALTSAALISLLLGRIAASVAQWIALRVTRRTDTVIDDQVLDRMAGPLRVLGALGFMRIAVSLIELEAGAAELAGQILLAVLAVALVWATLRIIDVIGAQLAAAPWALQRPSSRALLSLVGRAAKVVIVVIALISFLGSIGLPVASLLAGLGIGGIALAFGAQKTVENLFGAIALGIDQPLREGDFVRVEADVLGTVEAVGLRSTRIRTLDRTVVSLPNGRLADMKIETFAARDRCRIAGTLGVVYGTSAEQLREVLEGFERVLRNHPQIWPDDVVVKFANFGESSLDIEVMAWFQTADYGQFRNCRQDVLLGFMDVVERAHTSFAFPTRTLHLVPSRPDVPGTPPL